MGRQGLQPIGKSSLKTSWTCAHHGAISVTRSAVLQSQIQAGRCLPALTTEIGDQFRHGERDSNQRCN